MARRVGLVACVLLLAAGPRVAYAQDELGASQVRYIAELKQRNADYGPGCNGIGISVPQTVNMPTDLTTRWVAGHSACIPGLRLAMICIGEVAGADRVIGCTLLVADGAAGSIACDGFTLIAPNTRLTADPVLSDAVAEGAEGGSQSCAESQELVPGATVAAGFIVPAAESMGDLGMLIAVDGSEVPAFLIPSGQLGSVAATVDA
jgi:hypothetical protein